MENSFFHGYESNVHDEIDAKRAPIWLKILFGATIAIIFICVIIFVFFSESFETMTILTLGGFMMGFSFISISIMVNTITKIAGTSSSIVRTVTSVFIGIGILFLVITLLLYIVDWQLLLLIGAPILLLGIFGGLGIGLLIAGNKKKASIGNCSIKVMGKCVGFAQIDPPIQIWEYSYQNGVYRATQKQPISMEKVTVGNESILYFDPMNPGEVYCPIDNDFKFFINNGIIFLVFGILLSIAMLIVLLLVF